MIQSKELLLKILQKISAFLSVAIVFEGKIKAAYQIVSQLLKEFDLFRN